MGGVVSNAPPSIPLFRVGALARRWGVSKGRQPLREAPCQRRFNHFLHRLEAELRVEKVDGTMASETAMGRPK